MHPQPRMQNKKAYEHSHHGHTGDTRHSLRNGFNGFLRALPGDRACLPPSSAFPRNLTPASGRQDHTTSPSASAPFVEPCWPRPPHPAHVRDDRETPLVSRNFGRMCERAVDRQPPVAETEPATPQRRQSLSQSEGQLRCLPQPEQLQGLRARTEQGREWMMAQDDLVVVGIDVAKDKVDACIRAFALRQVFPSAAQGHRKLIAWLRKHKVTKAVMEASGGFERDWAKGLRHAGIEVRIVHPHPVRSFALSAGRLAKNDAIDAEMIAWFAETFSEAPSQRHDAAHEELLALVKARNGLLDLKTRLQSQNDHAALGPVQKAHVHF